MDVKQKGLRVQVTYANDMVLARTVLTAVTCRHLHVNALTTVTLLKLSLCIINTCREQPLTRLSPAIHAAALLHMIAVL